MMNYEEQQRVLAGATEVPHENNALLKRIAELEADLARSRREIATLWEAYEAQLKRIVTLSDERIALKAWLEERIASWGNHSGSMSQGYYNAYEACLDRLGVRHEGL
jgi:hypothetical protein